MEQVSSDWQGRERRTNHRLRFLIDELQAGVRGNREAVANLADRVIVLEHDVEALKGVEE